MDKKIRNSIKAIIIRDNRLLTIKCEDEMGTFYLLPGGGQEKYELMPDALKRECIEEVGVDVEPGRLMFIREYLSDNHEFAEYDNHVHQIEFMFETTIIGDAEPTMGEHGDPYQVGIEWLELDNLMDYRLYPQTLRDKLMNSKYDGPIYLGDIN